MGAEMSIQELRKLSATDIGEAVTKFGISYHPYKQEIVEHDIDGEYLSSCPLDESSMNKLMLDCNIRNVAHKFKLREKLSNIRSSGTLITYISLFRTITK